MNGVVITSKEKLTKEMERVALRAKLFGERCKAMLEKQKGD